MWADDYYSRIYSAVYSLTLQSSKGDDSIKDACNGQITWHKKLKSKSFGLHKNGNVIRHGVVAFSFFRTETGQRW